MKTTNEIKPAKSIKRFTMVGIALTALVITVLASFAVSGTLAKFIDTVGAQSGAVPAAQFNFNEVYDVETNTFTPIVWNLDQLGATINPNYSSKVFYPGAYGDFSMDVTFISDVPAMAEVTVDLINETGAFLPTVYGRDSDVSLRDLISLNFIAIIKDRGVEPTAEEIDFANDGITVRLGEFEEKLATTLENTIGENGAYYTLGTLIEKTVYVYWKWDFELSTENNQFDTLFGNYVNKFREDGIESELGIGVVMIVTQDTLDGSGIVNALTPSSPTVEIEDMTTTSIIVEPVGNGEYALLPAEEYDAMAGASVILGNSTASLEIFQQATADLPGQQNIANNVLHSLVWQQSNEFTDLEIGTEYVAFVRVKAVSMVPASAPALKRTGTRPEIPAASVETATSNSIAINQSANNQYSLDGVNWQDVNTFDGLQPGQQYNVHVRVKANGAIPASQARTITAVTAPTSPASISVASVTYNSLTLTAIDGAEYSRNGTTWQVSNVFTGLAQKTQYTFYARIKAVGSVSASEPTSAQFYTTPSTPSAAAIGATDSSITLTLVAGAEYSVDGTTWQSSNVIIDLTPATSYSLKIRIAEVGNIPASGIYTRVAYTSQVAPSAPAAASATFNSVTLTAVAGNEYSRNGTTWQASNIFTSLTASTEYTFYSRVRASGSIPASPASASITAYTAPTTPPAFTAGSAGVVATTTTLTLPVISGAEYSINGTTWQDSNVFTELNSGTAYTAYIRIKANGEIPASATVSAALGTMPVTPTAPTLASVTFNAVTLNAISGAEYSRNGTTWQASTLFSSLSPATQYTFYSRIKAVGSVPASAPSSTIAYTAPSTPVFTAGSAGIVATTTSLTLPVISGAEYSLNGTTWQDSNEFTELTPGTAYTAYVRIKANGGVPASTTVSAALGTRPVAPNAPTVASVTYNSVTLTSVAGNEYSKNGTTWQTSNIFTSLTPATQHTFYSRIRAVGSVPASANSESVSTYTAPATPTATVSSVTSSSITVTPVVGAEYSLNGTDWQASNVFSDLTPATSYTLRARIPASGEIPVSAVGSVVQYTAPVTPDEPTMANVTYNSVTLTSIIGAEYSINGTTWQDSNVFVSLNSATEYTFYTRIKASGSVPASASSSIIAYTAPSTPVSVSVSNVTSSTVTVTPITDAEYSADGITWQDSNILIELNPATQYTVYARIKANGSVPASASNTATAYTAPSAPTVASVTFNSLTLTAISGAEYSRNGTTWQDSTLFSSLSPATPYTFYARIKAVTGVPASAISSSIAYTAPSTPTASVPSVTESSITVTPITGAEYSIDGTNWQVSNVFNDLTPATSYTLRVRIAASGNIPASAIASIVRYTSQVAPSAPTVASVTFNSVTLTAVAGNDYSINGTTWQTSNIFTSLSPATQYTFYSRIKLAGSIPASPASEPITAYTAPATPASVSVSNVTSSTVTVTPITGAEYSADGTTWQDSNVLTELNPATQYTVYARIKSVGLVPASASNSATAYTAPSAPTVASVTFNSLTLTAISGAEYSRNGTTWQAGTLFSSLSPATQYTFYARIKAVTGVPASAISSSIAYTAPSTPASVSVSSVTESSITVTPITGAEYSINGIDWQDSNILIELNAATQYTFYARIKANGLVPASASRSATTYTAAQTPTASVSSVTSSSVTLVSITGAEYSDNGTTWKAGNVFSDLTPATQYTFYARIKAVGSVPASAAASVAAYTAPNFTAGSAGIVATTTSLTLPEISGAEYSLNGTDWQDSNEFTELTIGTAYTAYIRIKAVGEAPASAIASVDLGTRPETPEAPTFVSATYDTVALTEMNGVVFGASSDGGTTIIWQSSNIFTGLHSNWAYSFYTKVAANGSIPDSEVSSVLNVTTEEYVWDGTSAFIPTTTIIDSKTYYLIYNAGELAWFRNRVNAGSNTINGKLMADIELNDTTNWQSWTDSTTGLNSWAPIGGFFGTFDGNGYAVKGIYISTTSDRQGLFGTVSGYMSNRGTIINLGVEESFIKGGARYVGGVVGYIGYADVTNCYNTGSVSGTQYVSGVVGYSDYDVFVTDCYNTGSVSGSSNVGGVVGYAGNNYSSKTTIDNCYNTGNILGERWTGGVVGYVAGGSSSVTNSYNTGLISGTTSVGGVVGEASASSVTNSYNTGTISGTGTVGGVAGVARTIDSCYNTGNVSATSSYAGGIVGVTTGGVTDGFVTNCYNTGSVSGSECVGGIAGSSYTLTNCYNTGNVSGSERVGGLAGIACGPITNSYNAGSVTGTGSLGGIAGYVSNFNHRVTITFCYHLNTLGLSTYSGEYYIATDYSAPTVTGCGTFTNDVSGLTTLLTNLNAQRGTNKAWTRDIDGVINGGLPYFVE